VNYLYPSYIQTDCEKDLWDSRERDRQVIHAMQRRIAGNPLRDLLWRRPWRSNHGPQSVRHFFQWIRAAHDCHDPSVGCSCQPSFRFPPIVPQAFNEERES
jgi:hypothetical protein